MIFTIAFIFFTNLLLIQTRRNFRIKHPYENIYFGLGTDNRVTLVKFNKSDLFRDKVSLRIPGTVNVVVLKGDQKVWDMANAESLIYYPLHDGKNQRWEVIHLLRDVIVITSPAFDRCLDWATLPISMKPCNVENEYKNQVFLITDHSGVWRGYMNYDYYWNVSPDVVYPWGECFDCLPGGFGSEHQAEEIATNHGPYLTSSTGNSLHGYGIFDGLTERIFSG